MKIHILSDLHIEFDPLSVPETDADVVVLAGDIHLGDQGVDWALEQFPNKPVIYVLGNHEFYREDFSELISELKPKTLGSHIHLLENESVVIDGVRFLGCSLWTDFELDNNLPVSCQIAQSVLADYHAITVRSGHSRLSPKDTILRHKQSRKWLEETLPKSNLATVVVTHHAPSTQSIAQQYQGNNLNPAFISNLNSLVESSGARYWIHGHTHTRFDYQLGATRVICNPRGYRGEVIDFDTKLVIKV